MSRRYGRKQRRAALDRIAVLERDLSGVADSLIRTVKAADKREGELMDKVEFLLDRIRLWDSEIRSLLGPYTSFAINEPTFRVDSPDQIRQMAVMPPMPIGFLSIDSPAQMESIAYYIETMLGFMCGLDEDILTRLRRCLTVRVMVGRDPHGETAYFVVSNEVWHQMKRDGPNNPGLERFIHRIAGDLVRLLVAPPKKKPDRAPAPMPQGHSRDWIR